MENKHENKLDRARDGWTAALDWNIVDGKLDTLFLLVRRSA
jgi:hypothetical protein